MQMILQSVVGSTALGLQTPTSDIDLMGIGLETCSEALPVVGQPLENIVTTSPDSTTYTLRKWLSLAVKGNPTILGMLFITPQFSIAVGQELLDLAPAIISRQCGPAFLGYMRAQRERLAGERGQMRIHRPELISQHGYDVKYAMHALRLGYQGIELMETGRMSYPMTGLTRELLMDVRAGVVPKSSLMSVLSATELLLAEAIEESSLQAKPDLERIQTWVNTTYLRHWTASTHSTPTIRSSHPHSG